MKRELLIKTFLAGILLTTSEVVPVLAFTPTQDASDKCMDAVASSERAIEKIKDIQLSVLLLKDNGSSIESLPADHLPDPDAPKDRPYSYEFRMGGTPAITVMESPEFRKIIATRIIKNCLSVAIVTFSVDHTDYQITYGLMKDGMIKQFKCVDINVTKPRWGYISCV